MSFLNDVLVTETAAAALQVGHARHAYSLALYMQHLYSSTDDVAGEVVSTLQQSSTLLTQLGEMHQALQSGGGSLHVSGEMNSATRRLFEEVEPYYLQLNSNMASVVAIMSDTNRGTDTATLSIHVRNVGSMSQEYATLLDEVSHEYRQDSNDKVASARVVIWSVWGVAVGVGVLMVLVVHVTVSERVRVLFDTLIACLINANNSTQQLHGMLQLQKEWDLQRVLTHKEAQQLFIDYAKARFSLEQVLFWLTMHKYQNRELPFDTATKIYEKFIRSGCEMELNIDYKLRRELAEVFEHSKAGNYRELLEEAKQESYHLMNNNLLTGFLKETRPFNRL